MFARVGSRVISASFGSASKGSGRGLLARVNRARNMGSKEGPYSAPKGESYPNEPYPLGLVPGKKSEGWEAITYACYVGCTLWLVIGLSTKESDGFKTWARNEALAREKAVENGEEIEFGKYYSAGDRGYEVEEIDTMPVSKSSD